MRNGAEGSPTADSISPGSYRWTALGVGVGHAVVRVRLEMC